MAKQKPGADNNETLNDGPAADAACGTCSETVIKKDRALQCDLCQLWHHIECETVSNQMYRLIQEMANEDNASCLHCYCRKCNIIAKGFMSGMTQLQERQTVLEDKVVQLEGNLTGQITRLGGTVEDLVTHVKGRDTQLQELENGLAKCMDKTKVAVNIEDIVREVQDRDRRDRNTVIFNVPESTQCNGKEQSATGQGRRERNRPDSHEHRSGGETATDNAPWQLYRGKMSTHQIDIQGWRGTRERAQIVF